MKLKKYKYERVVEKEFEVELPTHTEYFFQTGERRSLRFQPIWTAWEPDKQRVFKYKITMVYLSFEVKAMVENVLVDHIEEHYYGLPGKNSLNTLIQEWIDGNLQKRTKDQFESDLNTVLEKIRK